MQKFDFSSFIRTTIICAAVTAILLAALAGIMYFLRPSDSVISFGILLSYILPCLLGGLLTGKKSKTRKFLWGLGFGAFYFLLLLAISFASGQGLHSDIGPVFTAFASCAVSGMLGGIFS